VAEHHYIAARLAAYYARKSPPGLTDTDLLSHAEEALVEAVLSADPTNEGFESYLWERVRGALKDLIRKTAKELGRTSARPIDAPTEHMLRGASAGLNDFARGLQDPGRVWDHTRADAMVQLDRAGEEVAAALAVGGAGCVWYMRGEPGFVLRAEWVRTIRELRELVSNLPPVVAAIMELRFFQQREIEDIAAQTGLSAPTVTRRIKKAVELLRARMIAKEIDGTPQEA
jgi:RNA polymerase sigma factor (sigma-70 family)